MSLQWQWSKPRCSLFLCAIGLHKFDLYAATSTHGRNTKRTCYECGHSDARQSEEDVWEAG